MHGKATVPKVQNIGVTCLGKIGLSFGHRCFSVEISDRNEKNSGFLKKTAVFADF